MKKGFTLFTITMMAASALAQNPMPYSLQSPAEALDCLTKAVNAKGIKHAPMREAGEPSIITEQPAGDYKTFVRNADGYMSYYGVIVMPRYFENTLGEIVYGENNEVWMKNPIPAMVTDTWIKGELNDNRITFSFPQKVYDLTSPYDDSVTPLFADVFTYTSVEENKYTCVHDEDTPDTFEFIIDGDHIYSAYQSPEESHIIIGLAYEDRTWMGYGNYNYSFEPFDLKLAEVPATAEFNQWSMTYGGGDGIMCDVAIDGTKVYIKNFYPGIEGSIVGDIVDGQVVIPSGQYVGVSTGFIIYFIGSAIVEENGGQVPVIYDNFVFDYDPEEQKLTTPDPEILFMLSASTTQIVNLTYFTAPTMRLQPTMDIAAAPMDPWFSYYSPFEEQYGFGFLYFELPKTSDEGWLLDVNKYYYNIWVDGEPYAVESPIEGTEDEYEEITDIPYTFSFSPISNSSGGMTHYFLFPFDGWDTMSFQSYYVGGGSINKSNVVTIDSEGEVTVDPWTGVKKVETPASEITSVEYYNLMGNRISGQQLQQKGNVVVCLTRYADGTTKAVKIIR